MIKMASQLPLSSQQVWLVSSVIKVVDMALAVNLWQARLRPGHVIESLNTLAFVEIPNLHGVLILWRGRQGHEECLLSLD